MDRTFDTAEKNGFVLVGLVVGCGAVALVSLIADRMGFSQEMPRMIMNSGASWYGENSSFFQK